MRTQEQRNEQTIAIATALGLFMVIVVAGGAAVWLADLTVGVSDTLGPSIFPALVCVAGAVAVTNLVRATRRGAGGHR